MVKCYGCKHLRQVGWDYFCLFKEFSLKYRIDTIDYVIIKDTPKWCPLKEVNKMDYYTKQYCNICKKEVKIDALDFLMNLDKLDKMCICDKCKEIKKED